MHKQEAMKRGQKEQTEAIEAFVTQDSIEAKDPIQAQPPPQAPEKQLPPAVTPTDSFSGLAQGADSAQHALTPPDSASGLHMAPSAHGASPTAAQLVSSESPPQTIMAEPTAGAFTPVVSNPPQPELSTPERFITERPPDSMPNASQEVATVTTQGSGKQPESEEAKRLVSKANNCQRQEDFEGAIVIYGQALEQARNTDLRSAILFNRSVALARLLRWEESLQDANVCVRINPNWPRGPECQGTALEGLGRLHEALAAFETARTLDPENRVSFHFVLNARP